MTLSPLDHRHEPVPPTDRTTETPLVVPSFGRTHYFGGAMLTNIIIAELIFVLALVVTLWATWPEVPWDALQYGGAAAMVVFPIALYPFSKVAWLAADVLIRPVTREELLEESPRA